MEEQQENPYDSVGFFSRIFFWWLNEFAIKGLKREFEETDLYKHPKADDSEYLGKLFEKEWNDELRKKNPSLLKIIFHVFRYQFLLFCLLNIVQECFVLVIQAYLVGVVIEHFQYKFEEEKFVAYLSATGVICCVLHFIFSLNAFLFFTFRINMKIGIAISNIIYKKALRLSHASLRNSHIGQMVNLLSNDINTFKNFFNYTIYLISGPLQLIITMIMLWQYFGPAVLAGLSIILVYVPLQIGLGRMLSSLRFKTSKHSDKRLQLLNELFAGMRVIKMYTWEILFAELVEQERKKELKNIKKRIFADGIPYTMGLIMIKLMLFVSFFAYFMTDGKLKSTVAFVTSTLLVNTYKCMLLLFPKAVSCIAEVLVSIKRIQKFLLLEDKQNMINIEDSRSGFKDYGIWVDSIFVSWNKDKNPALQNITLNAQPGDLLIIVGSVGSGKTSLLMALLGEIPISSGEIRLRGKVSYTSQEVWIYNGTIRENILFCNDYHENKYKEVLFVSALEKDINDLPEGDLTLVGERGRIMSGGQKSRINLARALYHDADIFILDDPLSAVDAPVAKHIFENCIRKYLKDKVTILATHQVQFLKSATKIILLNEGKIQAVGDYKEMTKQGINFGLLSERFKTDIGSTLDSKDRLFEDKSVTGSVNVIHDRENIKQDKAEDKTIETENLNNKMKMKLSSRAVAYNKYINAGVGKVFPMVLIFLFLLTQTLLNGSDYWIVKWTNRDFYYDIGKNESANCTIKTSNIINKTNCIESEDLPGITEETNLYVYSVLIFGLIISFLIATISYLIMCTKCSTNLHKNYLSCIVRVPVSFLDMTPIGNLLSRFSRDMSIVDQQLPVSSLFFITAFINILGMIVLQIIIEPYLIISSLILLIWVSLFFSLFLGVTNNIYRLEGSCSNAIFSHLSITLYGISTIRAFRAENSFERRFNIYQNKHTSSEFLSICIYIWNVMKIQISCFLNIVITIATVFSVSSITAGKVGLIMSYSLTMIIIFVHIHINTVMTIGQLISAERILDYSKLPSEASLTSSPDKTPPEDWPQKGIIEFRNVSLQYKGDTQHVLKNLNFHIKPGEKVGIVGRTGAGKSSIIAALFRMVETTGVISIDGIRTNGIGLHDLRNKISIIPQDPLLFTGSLRRNIDPFNKYTDETLWKILEEIQLKNAVRNLKGGLDAELSEGGSNFSVGERQLICLARTILHQNKILVLDEATAFIDKQTDFLIQKTIREKFTSSTILTIAHRLQTIMDSDRIMIVEDGKIEEFDKPYVLLRNPNSVFYKMAKSAGKEMSKYLHAIENYVHKNEG